MDSWLDGAVDLPVVPAELMHPFRIRKQPFGLRTDECLDQHFGGFSLVVSWPPAHCQSAWESTNRPATDLEIHVFFHFFRLRD